MKILLSTPSLRKEVGGPAYSVRAIDAYLQRIGVNTSLATRRGHGGESVPLLGWRARFGGVDLVHNFGTWTPFNHRVAACARRAGIPHVLCPMGMLEPWVLSNKRLKKRLGLAAYQAEDIARSAAIHATAVSEAQNLRALGIEVPLAVIPHGVDIPAHVPARTEGATRTALFMSRIHPKKGILDLVGAWARLRPSGWRLVIAGPDEGGHVAVVEEAIGRQALSEQIRLAGPVYGAAKVSLYTNADLFILPTYSENFGLVVPEALGYGIPVITTTGAPWKELADARAGWWIQPGEEALTVTLSQVFSAPLAELRAMGARGRRLVEMRYQWPAVIQLHRELYEWLLGAGPRPNFVLE